MYRKIYHPKRLINKSRLTEIYALRVEAYKNSSKACFLDERILKSGWFDKLDESNETIHWIIEDQMKIIASARLAILDNTSDLEDLEVALKKFELPNTRPLAYYSRLVVHQNYRNLGLSKILDHARLKFLSKKKDLKFAIAWAIARRHKALSKNGFEYLADFEYHWSKNKTSMGMCIF